MSAGRQRNASAVGNAARMTPAEADSLIRQLLSGDFADTLGIVARARTSDEPIVLVAAALLDPAAPELLARATGLAANTRDRQLVAIAAAHLAGDSELVDAFAREHLVDYPDSILVAWIAAAARPSETRVPSVPSAAPKSPVVPQQPTQARQLARPSHHTKEKS